MDELDSASLHITSSTTLLTSCLKLMPKLCLQIESWRALQRPPSGLPLHFPHDEDVPPGFQVPEQMSNNACAQLIAVLLGHVVLEMLTVPTGLVTVTCS